MNVGPITVGSVRKTADAIILDKIAGLGPNAHGTIGNL
jgi:hypothetical protein